jgi:hypothetical protein
VRQVTTITVATQGRPGAQDRWPILHNPRARGRLAWTVYRELAHVVLLTRRLAVSEQCGRAARDDLAARGEDLNDSTGCINRHSFGVFIAVLAVRVSNLERRRQFETIFVQRYWSLIDCLSLDAQKGTVVRKSKYRTRKLFVPTFDSARRSWGSAKRRGKSGRSG